MQWVGITENNCVITGYRFIQQILKHYPPFEQLGIQEEPYYYNYQIFENTKSSFLGL